mmetsp:Transcript_22321/g.19824  ORF Transcript_22321/g.19824 Transcript_22321/m.19824 type:complete len:181 (+) Transcript_22321:10-552(+)
MSPLLSLSLLLAFFYTGAAIGVDLIKSENYCFKLSANATDSIRISFSVSGKGNDKCLIQFYNPQNIVISDYTSKRHGYVNHIAETAGIYRICFMRQDMNIKKVTLNMRLMKELQPESEKAKEEDVNGIISRLQSIRSDLNRVQENLEEMQQNAITKKCDSGIFDTLELRGNSQKFNPSLE